jgi:uncharacterized phiE125 gp8 family phage protein
MFLTRTVAPAALPVGLEDMREHLRLDARDEDYLVIAYTGAAVDAIEEMTGRALMPQTWALSVGGPDATNSIVLPRPPVSSIVSLTYYDADDVQQTLATSDFYLFATNDHARVTPKSSAVWPITRDRPDAITVTFTAGYSSVPTSIVHAVKMLVSHWFENRSAAGGDAREIPYAVEHLVGLHRVGWVGA